MKSQVPGLTAEIAENSIYAYLEHQPGMQIVTSKRRITVERVTAADRQCLNLEDYDCLAVVTGNTFNSDGVMFEYTQSRHHPEHFSYQDTANRKRIRGPFSPTPVPQLQDSEAFCIKQLQKAFLIGAVLRSGKKTLQNVYKFQVEYSV